ncbi:hypothetical protein RYH73_21115 [Olivibacter sp. CPCC 100613]|uniref:hypothetical protein n=1 Tax=Olivibacter sp. CPCC 100613 TaxID=3079931 RepID=UPI002FFA1C03
MDNKSNYQDDLASIKGMLANPKDTPFIVPNGYFNTLETNIMKRISVISDTEKSFGVPEGYFESLSEHIFAKIKKENYATPINSFDKTEHHPFIKVLKEKVSTPGFTTPQNYFDELSQKINREIAPSVEKEKSKEIIFPIRRKNRILSWIGYAAAACIAISLGIYGFLQYQSNTFERTLKSIPDSEIVNYLQYYSEPGDAAFLEAQFDDVIQMDKPQFSEEDIEAYLDYSI